MLEMLLMDFDVEWMRIKIYEKSNIAIGCYRCRKSRAIVKQNRSITIVAYIPRVGPYGNDIAAEIPGTEQKFRKNEIEIAQWYFRKLCRTLKKGVLQGTRKENKPFGRWDKEG